MCCRRVNRTQRIFFLLVIVLLGCLVNKYGQPVQLSFVHQNTNTTCVLPDLDPFDKSILKFIYHPKPIVCDPSPSLVYVDDKGFLQINNSLVNRIGKSDVRCVYRDVERKGENDIVLSSDIVFSETVKLSSDLIHVLCKKNDDTIFDRILYNIDSDSVMRKKPIEKETEDRLSVFIFGYDSVSRLAAERKMPKTMSFLRKQLNGNVFNGYTMVGGNTYPNIIAGFTGKTASSSELPPLDTKTDFTDSYPFIWKKFQAQNYASMYSEDFPEISIFDNNMAGFENPPADHYLRSYYVAQKKVNYIQTNIEMFKLLMYLEDKKISLGKYSPLCYQNKPKHVLHMDHYKQFIKNYKGYAKFAFSWLTEITHDFMNFLELVDYDTMDLFQFMKEEGHLNNAVLIFMSDHGPRNDELRNSAIGRIEERMPLLSIVLPEHIKQKYPNIAANLQKNENRLLSPYDLHETLVDISNNDFDDIQNVILERPYPRGISLFRNIPKDRTCSDAGIAEHFCACYTMRNISVSSKEVKTLSEFAVKAMNLKLSEVKSVCSELYLDKVLEAQKIESGLEQHSTFQRATIFNLFYKPEKSQEQRYLILFQTSPGKGLFEATISFTSINDPTSFKLLGDFSRTNKYRNQSHCVHRQNLKPICYCRVQI